MDAARRLWWSVPCVELAAAVALLAAPGHPATAVLTLAVFGAFLAAGMMALARRASIPCACFGRQSGGTLGWRQVLQLVPVVAVLPVLQGYDPGRSAQEAVALLTAAVAVSAVVLGGPAFVAWRQVRLMRTSLLEARVETRRVGLEEEYG